MNQLALIILLGLLSATCIFTYGNGESHSPSTGTLECPSPNVIRVKYKCPGPSNTWTDCIRSHCCPGFKLIDGRCIPKDANPCDLNLCEQRCSFIFQRVVCTCWDGYRFNPLQQKRGDKSSCTDIDECAEGLHDCEQICKNKPGTYSCDCKDQYQLRIDNKTCVQVSRSGSDNVENTNDAERCLTSCDTVRRLEQKISKIQEKLIALETAVALSMQQSGHSKSIEPDLLTASAAYSDDLGSQTYSILDSFVHTGAGYCKCQRGPIGPPGPTGGTGQKGAIGDRGPRGAKGAAVNVDFLLLMLADMHHDIVLLQERVFPGEKLPKFDFEKALKKQRSIEEPTRLPAVQTSEVEHFEASKPVRFLDYVPEDSLLESSGEELDQYEE